MDISPSTDQNHATHHSVIVSRRFTPMNWTYLIVAVLVVAAFLWLKQSGQIGTEAAVALLKQGAPVIDVRTPEEFAGGAVPGAVNIPLDRVRDDVPKIFPDKSQPLLLHCLSGGRSLMATRSLRALGYTQAHNLGSVSRARDVVGRSH